MGDSLDFRHFAKNNEQGIHVQIYSDNSKTVNCINAMGVYILENVILLLKIFDNGA